MQLHKLLSGRLGRDVAVLFAIAALAVAIVACGGGGGKKTVERLYSPQNEEVDVYDLVTGQSTVLIPKDGWVNGQVCSMPDGSGNFIAAEDKDEEKGVRSGWSIFTADGTFVKKLPEPKAASEGGHIDPYGCVFNDNRLLFTSDVGSGNFTSADGKLLVFFPPDYETSCILDSTIHVAGGVVLDDAGNLYVPQTVPPGEILRFAPPYPKNANECQSVPANSSTFIQDPDMTTPLGIVRAPNGNWYVSSVFLPPTIREYDTKGKFVRTIIEGKDIGNPAGLAVDSKGTLYYADLGLVTKPNGLPGPGPDKGTVRKVAFDKSGKPMPPVTMGTGLNFPDGLGILKVKASN